MKKGRERERIFYTACHFAAVFIQISRRHFRDSMSREQSADVSIVANLRWKKTRKREEKREPFSRSRRLRKKKMLELAEYRLTAPDRPDISSLPWKSNVSRCILEIACTNIGAAALLSDSRADIWRRQSRPEETLFLTVMVPVTFPQYVLRSCLVETRSFIFNWREEAKRLR